MLQPKKLAEQLQLQLWTLKCNSRPTVPVWGPIDSWGGRGGGKLEPLANHWYEVCSLNSIKWGRTLAWPGAFFYFFFFLFKKAWKNLKGTKQKAIKKKTMGVCVSYWVWPLPFSLKKKYLTWQKKKNYEKLQIIFHHAKNILIFKTSRVDLRLQWGLKQSYNPHQELFNNMSHVAYTWRKKVDSWLLVLGSQIISLTPDFSFYHNLCFKCPNAWCNPILDI